MGTLVITGVTTVKSVNQRALSNILPGWFAVLITNPPNGSSDAQLISGIGANLSAPPLGFLQVTSDGSGFDYNADIQFGFDLITPIFALDGLPPVGFNFLPAGFQISTLILTVDCTLNNAPTGAVKIAGQTQSVPLILSTLNFNLVPSLLNPLSPSDFVNYVLELSTLYPAAFNFSADSLALFENLIITGTYSILSSQFTLQNPTTPVQAGDKVKITSATGGLDGVSQIQIGNITIDAGSYYIIIQEPNILWFYIPFGITSGLVTITLIGNGIQFSGSVILGTLQILFEDASGIYTLVKGQADDIIYIRDGYTTDTKLIILPDMMEDEIYEDDFFSLLSYPTKILSQNDIDEDYEVGDFSTISTLRVVVDTLAVEIPSPFIKTAFLP